MCKKEVWLIVLPEATPIASPEKNRQNHVDVVARSDCLVGAEQLQLDAS